MAPFTQGDGEPSPAPRPAAPPGATLYNADFRFRSRTEALPPSTPTAGAMATRCSSKHRAYREPRTSTSGPASARPLYASSTQLLWRMRDIWCFPKGREACLFPCVIRG